MDMIRKTFPVESKAIDREAGIYEVMITTEDQDRQKDIVRAAGGKVDAYLRNPVVLINHDYYDLPIAKTLNLMVIPGQGIKSTFQFPPVGTYDKADVVRRLWDAGFINAASIGFIPLESVPLDPANKRGAQEYTSWELLEWSVVGVPANSSALRLSIEEIDITTKRGRVLSAGNEKKLRSAQVLLEEVLSQLQAEESEPEQDGITGGESEPDTHSGKAESTADDDTEQRNKAYAALSDLFDTMRGLK